MPAFSLRASTRSRSAQPSSILKRQARLKQLTRWGLGGIASVLLMIAGCAGGRDDRSRSSIHGTTATQDADLRRLVNDEHRAGRFDGVVLVAGPHGVAGEFAAGLADRAFDAPHTVDEPMPVASVTKQFLAVCVLRGAQAGTIGLDDPVSKYLPSLDRPWATHLTIRQLLLHRSGLQQPESVLPGFYSRTELPQSSVELARLLGAAELTAEPGSRFEYNNTDYILLSAVLESVHHKPLHEVMQTEVFGPSGMTASGMIRGREIIARLPRSYDLDAGVSEQARFPEHQELANYRGAGAAYSTARDILAFNTALMGDVLLNPATRSVMFESSAQSGYAAMGCWAYPIDIKGEGTVRIVERHGAIEGYNIVNLFCPNKGISVILLCNISSFEEPQTWMRRGLAYRLFELALKHE